MNLYIEENANSNLQSVSYSSESIHNQDIKYLKVKQFVDNNLPVLEDDSPDESYEDEYAEKKYFDNPKQVKKGNWKGDGGKTGSAKMDILEVVANIDEISKQAENMKITRNDFINCLREVTRQKMIDIKDAKGIFETRIKKMIRA